MVGWLPSSEWSSGHCTVHLKVSTLERLHPERVNTTFKNK